ncbi:MAG TPA: hypothetical protein VGM37_09775 [Armatimonadota bacterium]|jgi:hypothetical protein
MRGHRSTRWLAPAVIVILAASSVSAQTVTLKKRGATSGSVNVSVTTQGAEKLVTARASNADAKTLFQEIAAKSGAKILLAPSVMARLSPSVETKPLETALRTIAAPAGLTVRKIVVPEASAASLTAASAASLSAALSGTPTNATVVDPATGKAVTLTFASAAPKLETGQTTVYYVMKTAGAGSQSAEEAVAEATAALSGLSLEQRMQAMRDMQRSMFQNMTDEERQQMRQQMQRNGGPGGPGGPGGMNGGPGGPPPDMGGSSDGSAPPPPPE